MLVQATLALLSLCSFVPPLSAQVAEDIATEQGAIIERFEPPLTARPTIELTIKNNGRDAASDETKPIPRKNGNRNDGLIAK